MRMPRLWQAALAVAMSATTGSASGTSSCRSQAGVIIAILPCVLIYLLLQKYYVAGFLNGAVK